MKYKTAAVAIAAAVLVITATVAILFPARDIQGPALPELNATIVPTWSPSPLTTLVPSPPVLLPSAVNISKEEAISRLREDYNFWDYTIENVTLTDRYTGKILYELSLVPGASGFYHENATFFIDAVTGDFYQPSQENAGITIKQAKGIIWQDFPEMPYDNIRVTFTNGSKTTSRGWDFRITRDNETLIFGSLFPDTGELREYTRQIPWSQRADTSPITLDAARLVADTEVMERNGNLPVVMTHAEYSPLLGMAWAKSSREYLFIYNRILQNVTCESDGISVTVHPVTGDIVRYQKKWVLTENALAPVSVPAIARGAAGSIVEQEARSHYPLSADRIRVRTVDLRWKDTGTEEGIAPAPESILLAWKVEFDDEYIRAQQNPDKGVGWVDAQNGSLLELHYRH